MTLGSKRRGSEIQDRKGNTIVDDPPLTDPPEDDPPLTDPPEDVSPLTDPLSDKSPFDELLLPLLLFVLPISLLNLGG